MNSFKCIILAAVSVLLANCGGGLGPSAASGTVTSAAASNAKMRTNLDQLMTNLVTTIQAPGVGLPGGVTASALEMKEEDIFAGCTTVTPSQTKDDDQDNIVKEKKYVYNCNGINYGNFTTDKKGTVLIQDLDDTVKTEDGGGYLFEYDLTQVSAGNFSSDWAGFYRLEKVGSKSVYTSKFKSIFTETHSGQDLAGGFESNYEHIIMPDDATKPWDKGSSTTDGFYRMVVRGDDGTGKILDWDFTFKITSKIKFELKGNSGCKYYYTDGYFEFTDASNNVLRYAYTCNSYTYSFNGTVLYTGN